MKKRKSKNKALNNNTLTILIRYLILLGLMFSLPLIYKFFTPLTINASAGLLDLLYRVDISNDIIVLNATTFIQLIPACIAGSAYLLLLILNLTIPMKLKKRIYTILLSFLFLFVLNVLRIFLLSILYHNNAPLVDFTHKLFWYVLSTVFVLLVWFLIVKIFSIKEIPIYTDFKLLLKDIKH